MLLVGNTPQHYEAKKEIFLLRFILDDLKISVYNCSLLVKDGPVTNFAGYLATGYLAIKTDTEYPAISQF